AVGEGNVVISYSGGSLSFLDRSGKPLPPKHSGDNVNPTFFDVLSPMLDFINGKLQSEGQLCFPEPGPRIGCIDTIYDGRVIYDQWHKRFWFIANSRANQLPDNGPYRFPLITMTKT